MNPTDLDNHTGLTTTYSTYSTEVQVLSTADLQAKAHELDAAVDIEDALDAAEALNGSLMQLEQRVQKIRQQLMRDMNAARGYRT